MKHDTNSYFKDHILLPCRFFSLCFIGNRESISCPVFVICILVHVDSLHTLAAD